MTHVGPAGYGHLALFALLVPYAAIRSSAKLKTRPFPPKATHFSAQVLILMFFFAVSAVVARREWIRLFPEEIPQPRMVLLGASVLVGMIVLMRPMWRARVEQRSRTAWLFMPRTPRERALWALCSVAAGISEEATYRGVMFALLWRLTGSALAAAFVSAAAFAISHVMQGARSVAIIFAIALMFQMLAWVSGSLYVGMAVHALYDLTAGVFYGRYADELGYPAEAMPPAA